MIDVTRAFGWTSEVRIALVLGGGNALGAYHAGLYQALDEAGIEPDWIVGTSIGAVTGAILAGNPRERRLDHLHRLWRPAEASGGWPMPWDMLPDEWRRTASAVTTMLGGRPGVFGPIGPFGSWWTHDPAAGAPGLYDTQMLGATLADLVDFARLNEGAPRFTAVAVDVESGEEVVFDTATQTLLPDHVRASAALLTSFPAVEIDGRLLADGGLSMNLPLDPVMAAADATPTLCIAADLLPLAAPRPRTLGEVVSRMQDLTFAAQSRRTLERWRALSAERGDDAPSVALAMLSYADQTREVAGKAMDFSPRSVRLRCDAGYADGSALMRRLRDGDIMVDAPGLNLI